MIDQEASDYNAIVPAHIAEDIRRHLSETFGDLVQSARIDAVLRASMLPYANARVFNYLAILIERDARQCLLADAPGPATRVGRDEL